MHDDASPMLV